MFCRTKDSIKYLQRNVLWFIIDQLRRHIAKFQIDFSKKQLQDCKFKFNEFVLALFLNKILVL